MYSLLFPEIQSFDLTSPCLDQEDLGRKYEIKPACSEISVKGRFRRALGHWKQINAPQFISETIEFGYKLPFLTTPLAIIFRNNKSTLDEPAFVESAIHSFLDLNCIEELMEPPEIINPLSVSKQKSGKKRLILDIRHVNFHLLNSNTKMFLSQKRFLGLVILCLLLI